jgi:hypothetical protein
MHKLAVPMLALAMVPASARLANAADHGPVFGLATPTNPKGGWSLDLGVNGREGAVGSAAALEGELSYGLTENLKLSASGPVVFQPDPYPHSSVTTNTPLAPISADSPGGDSNSRICRASVSRAPLLRAFSFRDRKRKLAFTGIFGADWATWSEP